MKIGVGQIIFMRSGAHQRMNYCWRTFAGDRKWRELEGDRKGPHHSRPYNDANLWGEKRLMS
jgi:hypothetical protein